MMPALEPEAGTEFLSLFPGRHIIVLGGSDGKFIDMEYNKYAQASMVAENRNKHVYFVVNEVSGKKRLDEEVVRCRAIFIDDDGDAKGGFTDPTKFPVPPNLTVETSPGKYHHHWLTDTTNINEWRGVQRSLINIFNGDPACSNPARIMRVPGYVNTKPTAKGWVAKLTVHSTVPYSWDKLVKHFPPTLEVGTKTLGEKPKFNLVEKLEEYLDGDDVHGSRISIAMHCANLGYTQQDTMDIITSVLEKAMRDGTVGGARGRERLANMRQAVTSAYAKVEREGSNIVSLRSAEKPEDKFTHLPRPPGPLADFADSVMAYSTMPSWEMALPVAMHCVTMFGGGIFRMGQTTGCRKREILASSSRGKSICTRYPREIVRLLAVGDKHIKHNPYNYSGSPAWSPAVIHAELVEHRVRGYTIAEGGLDKKSKAGSVEEMRKLWLELLTASHKSHIESKKYSGASTNNDHLGDFYGAVVSQLVESVPVHYMEALKGSHAHEGGDTGRTEVIFVPRTRDGRNRNPEGEIGKDILAAIKLFVHRFQEMNCARGDDPTNPDKFIDIGMGEIEDAWWELDDKIFAEMNQLQDYEHVKEAIMGRFMERVNTTLFIQAIWDAAYGQKELQTPKVTMEHFQFAVAYQTEINRALFANIEGGVFAEPLDRCVARIANRMDDFGSLRYDKEFANIKDRIISAQWITKVLGKCSEWDQLKLQLGSQSRAQSELYRALENEGVLILLPQQGKVTRWRLNK